MLASILLMWVSSAAARVTHSLPPVLAQNVSAGPASYQGMAGIPEATFVFRDGEHKQQVQVKSFYLDLYEVAVSDFKTFLAATGYRTTAVEHKEERLFDQTNAAGPDYPVGFVSHRDARAYCAWRGKRLPTPYEWQRAALGTDGRDWPWGAWAAGAANINTHAAVKPGSYPQDKSPYGVFDLGGNLLEWTTQGAIGGSYATDWQTPRILHRNLDDWVANTGFRCAAETPPSQQQ
jgi:formylglycine-generating enzyme required for sulfatase activity